MQAIEFAAQEIKNDAIKIPERYLEVLKGKGNVKVIILFDGEESSDWDVVAATQFLDGYAEGDHIYDKY